MADLDHILRLLNLVHAHLDNLDNWLDDQNYITKPGKDRIKEARKLLAQAHESLAELSMEE